MKKYLYLFLILLFTFTSIFSNGSKDDLINLYITGSLNGNLDGCDCKSSPVSGLVKTSVFLNKINKDTSILIDTGDIFGVYKDTILYTKIINAYKSIGYDITLFGDQDVNNGFNNINRLFSSHNVSILNDNNYTAITNKKIIIKKQDISISFITITDPDSFLFYPETITNNIKIEDPNITIQRLSEDHQSTINVLIFHGREENLINILKLHNKFDLAILGHEQKLITNKSYSGVPVFSPGEDGNNVLQLEISTTNNKIKINNLLHEFDYINDPDNPNIRNEINDYIKQLNEKLQNK